MRGGSPRLQSWVTDWLRFDPPTEFVLIALDLLPSQHAKTLESNRTTFADLSWPQRKLFPDIVGRRKPTRLENHLWDSR